ncbi:MAG: hypothetical protein KY476_13120 [Planctomycetes bacterium]|nr:hypothetical protein [Planctomycetota bacterium]
MPMITADVGHALHSAAQIAVKSATSLIEPIMVAVMGTIIGTIALAMLLPIFKLSSHAG